MLEAKIKSDSFSRINDDAVSLCCVAILQLLLLGLEDRRKVPDWILRLANVRDDWDMYPWGSPIRFCAPTTFNLRNRVKKVNKGRIERLPFNLGNAIGNDDAVEDDVLIMSACQTDDYIVHEDVDPSKIVQGGYNAILFQMLLLRETSFLICIWVVAIMELGDSHSEVGCPWT
ncbi:hypothetical protein Tco_1314668 [Tanacetum coccineum]